MLATLVVELPAVDRDVVSVALALDDPAGAVRAQHECPVALVAEGAGSNGATKLAVLS